MKRYYFENIYSFTEKFNLLRTFAGIFFGTRNLVFACGKADKLKESPGEYFCYTTASVAVLSTVLIHAWKACHSEEEKITLYEKIIMTIARMGVVFSAFNVATLNNDFVVAVNKDNSTQISYAVASFLMGAFAILSKPIQEITESNSDFISSFVASCPKSGIWIGSIFAGLITQTVVFEKEKTTGEMAALSITMACLFILEWSLFYAAIIKNESVENAKKFIESPLSITADIYEKIIWWMSFALDFTRSLISFFASVMVIPNILGLSPTFALATKGKVQQGIYAFLFGSTMLFGVNNTARVLSTRLSLCDTNISPDTQMKEIQP